MGTNWIQENCDGSTLVEREAVRYMRVRCDALASAPTPQHDGILTNRAEAGLVPAGGNTRFIGWDVMLAVLAAVMIFFLLAVVSFGILNSAVIVAGIVAAVGLGHYLLRGSVFGREWYARGSGLRLKTGD